jgi:hypothetical protein
MRPQQGRLNLSLFAAIWLRRFTGSQGLSEQRAGYLAKAIIV